MADSSLVTAIKRAAAATGADATLLMATALVENNGQWGSLSGPSGLGDYSNGQPTSFGPFQMHEGGALGSNPPSWAFTYAAVLNRAAAFARAQVASGTGAAAVQGPQHPDQYAAKVQAAIPQAEQLLAAAPTSSTPNPGAAIAALAGSQQGVPYSWDGGIGSGPTLGKADSSSSAGATTIGFDCSGLVLWAAAQIGIVLPHSSQQQWTLGIPVAKSDLQPGDVVFFNPDAKGLPQHEGIYAGSGKFIAAPHTGADVGTFSLSTPAYATSYMGARRYTAGVGVDRSGADITAIAGSLVAPDSTQLTSAVTKLQQNSHGGQSLAGSILGAGASAINTASGIPGVDEVVPGVGVVAGAIDAGKAAKGALGAVDSIPGAITGAVADVESKAAHALVYVGLLVLGLTLIYLGAKRAIAPDSTPIKDAIGKAGEAAAA